MRKMNEVRLDRHDGGWIHGADGNTHEAQGVTVYTAFWMGMIAAIVMIVYTTVSLLFETGLL